MKGSIVIDIFENDATISSAPRNAVANWLNCDIVVSEFEFYIYFQALGLDMNPQNS